MTRRLSKPRLIMRLKAKFYCTGFSSTYQIIGLGDAMRERLARRELIKGCAASSCGADGQRRESLGD